MRKRTVAVAVAVAVVAGALAVSYAAVAGQSEPDLEGTPDLIVREDVLGHQWVVREENLAASFCSVQEGGVTPGLRKLVRFTVMTPNIGDADIFVGDPNDHFEAGDGLFEFASCHNHFHFRHYALYELVDPATGYVWRAAKRGFCMLDTDPNPAWLGEPARSHQFRSCGAVGVPGNQGISSDWADTYRFFLGGQYFVLDGGDGQPPVPAGSYIIRITVNPPYVATGGEPCRELDTITELCHQLPESNYANNIGEVTIEIPAHPGKHGVGPLAGTDHPKTEPAEH